MGVDLEIDMEEAKGGIYLLHLRGRVDTSTTPFLEKKIGELVEQKRYQIGLDFTAVNYLSSAGMRLLLASTKQLQKRRGVLFLYGLQKEVQEVISLAGFDQILFLYATEQEARDALRGSDKEAQGY